MSEENVEFMRKVVDAWNSGGVEAVLPLYPEDVVWYPFPEGPESSSALHGHEGIREVMGGWTDSFDDYTVVLHEIRDLGDTVVALGETSGTISGSNVPVRQPIGVVAWDFRDGKIGKARFFPSWGEALEAAGLEE
jgi:ketosteroid isomerase-like protein